MPSSSTPSGVFRHARVGRIREMSNNGHSNFLSCENDKLQTKMGTASHFAHYAKWRQSLSTVARHRHRWAPQRQGAHRGVWTTWAAYGPVLERQRRRVCLPVPRIAGDFSLLTFVHIRINQQGWPHVSRLENRFSPVTLLSQYGRSAKPPLSAGHGFGGANTPDDDDGPAGLSASPLTKVHHRPPRAAGRVAVK